MLIAGAGKKKGPLRQRAVCPCASFLSQVGYHSVQQVCSRKSRGKKTMFTSSLGTGADRPDDQSGVRLLVVHLAVRKKNNQYRQLSNKKKNDDTGYCFWVLLFYPYLCKLCRIIKGDASSRWSWLGRMTLQGTNWVTIVCGALLSHYLDRLRQRGGCAPRWHVNILTTPTRRRRRRGKGRECLDPQWGSVTNHCAACF